MLHISQDLVTPPQLCMADSIGMKERVQRENSSDESLKPVSSTSSTVGGGLVKVRVKITPEDIEDWRQTPCLHPLVGVLRRTTHTNWRMVDSIMLAEKEPPFRTVFLGTDVMLHLIDCKNGYGPDSLECELDLFLPFFE